MKYQSYKVKENRKYHKILLGNYNLKEKVSNTNVSSKELFVMRNRFNTENAEILAIAREEQNALKIKRKHLCACGKQKGFSFRECYECNLKRKNGDISLSPPTP